MNNIKDIVEKINEKLGKSMYFYVSNDIEHGLGLSKFIEKFTHVCLKDSYYGEYLRKEGIDTICINDKKLRSSAELLDNVNIENSYVQTFKISPQFESKVLNSHAELMNTTNLLNTMFERKISQIRLFSSVGINVPEFMTGKMILMDYKTIVKNLGSEFVVQFDRGHTGSSTYFVKNENEYLDLVKQFPYREARILKLINGKTYTLNACMTQNGIYAGGLSEQLTGIDGLTAKKGGTVGNNFNHNLDSGVIDLILEELNKLQFLLGRNGYKGLFGLDFILDNESGNVYIIEMNARQTMSVAFHGALQRMLSQVPLGILHVAEFLGIRTQIDAFEYNKQALRSIEAFQIFKRNTDSGSTFSKSDLRTGEYYLTSDLNLKWIGQNYMVDSISRENIVLINQKQDVEIEENGEILRVQVLGQDVEKYTQLLLKIKS